MYLKRKISETDQVWLPGKSRNTNICVYIDMDIDIDIDILPTLLIEVLSTESFLEQLGQACLDVSRSGLWSSVR